MTRAHAARRGSPQLLWTAAGSIIGRYRTLFVVPGFGAQHQPLTGISIRQILSAKRFLLPAPPRTTCYPISNLDPNVSASDEMYRRVIEAVPEGICVVDPQGRTIFSNRRMAEILGIDFESMPGQSCFACVFPDELADAHLHFDRP